MSKPIVQIKDCYITKNNSWGLPANSNILSGIPIDYPDDHQYHYGCLTNGERIWTTAIQRIDGNIVETKRTIYKVLNWTSPDDEV